ncbi:hypothetical protein L798_13865 [Zootermopsis nevadensis]|uniref:Endonuclease-reverse transcriptase n=1 Tax=Zootermopsis nevadensis TaxID=136037 RepID=A0A067QQE1_ZOONE|nr:hypothetical protein L798_13865 [Zootermopsis nevadensis]
MRQGLWRIRMNMELEKLFKSSDIVAVIKARRIKWLGHILRMSDDRGCKMIINSKPPGKLKKGRLKLRWIEDVESDLKQMGVRGWRRKAQNRIGETGHRSQEKPRLH